MPNIQGPLHISPVDRAGSIFEISPRYSFLYKKFDEKAGWLGYRDLGNRAGNFPIWTLQPGYRDCPWRAIFSCARPVRSLTSRNAVPRIFWGPFGHFSFRLPGFNFPYEQKTKFVSPTGPARAHMKRPQGGHLIIDEFLGQRSQAKGFRNSRTHGSPQIVRKMPLL